MRQRQLFAAGLVLVFASAACYHATIETGLPMGTETIHQPWASSFIYGLVPPNTVSTASKCPKGVAKVETQHSFLNSLVGGLTFGIYTPMEITVTCANPRTAMGPAPQADIAVAAGAAPDAVAAQVGYAADMAVALHRAVYLQF
jgi:hypothetical protein